MERASSRRHRGSPTWSSPWRWPSRRRSTSGFNLDNSTHYGSDFATSVVVTVATLALAWRRRWPFATLCVVAGAIGIPELFGPLTFTLWGHFVPLLVAAYTVARLVQRAVGATRCGAGRRHHHGRDGARARGRNAGNIPFAVVPAAGLMIAGRVLQRRDARARALAEQHSGSRAEHKPRWRLPWPTNAAG